MSYQALYRVWRPQTFDEVSGQKMITQTIKNAIQQENTSHAYLFTGPRGTGKTSAAKIFAKAINCPNQEKGEPCNQCDICRQITDGSLGDVIEIDAASNNGVEEIRDIRDKANYAPTQADYKVYIIDEVHMLSMGAFNALLKTLEEPPTNVVFILATTEPHKIPLTIISRTQRFDFRRISSEDIKERMTYILNQIRVDFEEEALTIIANAAEGGMRDALSILDQSISFMDDILTKEVTMEITGSITMDLLLDYVQVVESQDSEKALTIVQKVLAEGKSSSRFIEDLILLCRDLLLGKVENQGQVSFKLAKASEQFYQVAKETSAQTLYKMIEILNDTQQELRFSNHDEVYLEVATIKLTTSKQIEAFEEAPSTRKAPPSQVASGEEVQALKRELAQLKKAVNNQETSSPSPNNQSAQPKRKPANNNQKFKVNVKAVNKVLSQATKEHLTELKALWVDLFDVLDNSQKGIMYNSTPVAASPTGLVVTFEYDILCEKAEKDPKIQQAIGDYIEKILDYRPNLICVPAAEWPGLRQNFIKQMKRNNQSSSLEGNEESKETNDQASNEENFQEKEDNQEDQVVTKAYQLFGKENVNVIEN